MELECVSLFRSSPHDLLVRLNVPADAEKRSLQVMSPQEVQQRLVALPRRKVIERQVYGPRSSGFLSVDQVPENLLHGSGTDDPLSGVHHPPAWIEDEGVGDSADAQ